VSETAEIEFNGVPVAAVTPRMLHRTKRDTARPKDREDTCQSKQLVSFIMIM
jgi:hypothetical protein